MIVLVTGRRVDCKTVASWLGTTEERIANAIEEIGSNRIGDIKKYVDPERYSCCSEAAARETIRKLDPEEVQDLGKHSKGTRYHYRILCELFGLPPEWEFIMQETFPNY